VRAVRLELLERVLAKIRGGPASAADFEAARKILADLERAEVRPPEEDEDPVLRAIEAD
jgi:hypothetical protein